jgi:predicted acetyltransferase
MRGKNFGYHFACVIFNKYPGQWQVRQIENAGAAISFWRSVIKKYTADKYEESVVSDPDWGVVTRQRFTSAKK